MDDTVAALNRILEQLERELAGFEIETAWRRRDPERRAVIGSLCEAFHKHMTDLIGQQRGRCDGGQGHE